MSTKPNQFEIMQKIHEAITEVAEVTGMLYYDYAVQGAFNAYTIYTECMLYLDDQSDADIDVLASNSDMDFLVLSLKYDVMSQTIEVYDITEEHPGYDFNDGVTNLIALFVGNFVSYETFKEFVLKAYLDTFSPGE